MSNQLGLFKPSEVETEKPEVPVAVKLGNKTAHIMLKSQRRRALKRLQKFSKNSKARISG